jgi:IclR family transcriptional regulator, acetate operon repressor
MKLLDLGKKAAGNLDLRAVAVPFLRELNRALDETVRLTVVDGERCS